MSNLSRSGKFNPVGHIHETVIKPDPFNRAWVEVDSGAIENNARILKRFINEDCA